MIKRIDSQLEKYDERVGSTLHVIQTNPKGQISLEDLKRAMSVIKHKPDDEHIEELGKKLDVDSDGFVELDHVIELTQDHGLGIVMDDDDAKRLLDKGADIRRSKDVKELKWVFFVCRTPEYDADSDRPKREDILSDD
jgi:LETM1 and EF-hand domain-containing protein 1